MDRDRFVISDAVWEKVASLRMLLAFDPGERWEYGVNIDWVGLLVEAASGQKLDVYFRENIFLITLFPQPSGGGTYREH